MDSKLRKMEVQLERWRQRIDDLSAKSHIVGVPTRFDVVMRIDELKALHAIARTKLDDFMLVRDTATEVHSELMGAWNDLRAALERPAP